MKSKLGELFQELKAQTEGKTEMDIPAILSIFEQVKSLEDSFYTELDFDMIKDYGELLYKIGATNLLSIVAEHSPLMMLSYAPHIRELLQDETAIAIAVYTIKHALMLFMAEEKAKASGAQMAWLVAPEQPQESHPSSDLPVPPPDEPQITS
jgi:hypothetical protein